MHALSRRALLLLTLPFVLSCGCVTHVTQTVWDHGTMYHQFGNLKSAYVSPAGDICLVYGTKSWRDDKWVGEYQKYLLLEAETVARLKCERRYGPGYRIVPTELEEFVLPRSLVRRTFDEEELARRIQGWQEIDFVILDRLESWKLLSAESEREVEKARRMGKAIVNGNVVELPYMGDRLVVPIPSRKGISKRSVPVRVVLTPVAVVVDIVTVPLWVPIVIYLFAIGPI